ncbi:hypothetical protein [Cellulomonas hominis]
MLPPTDRSRTSATLRAVLPLALGAGLLLGLGACTGDDPTTAPLPSGSASTFLAIEPSPSPTEALLPDDLGAGSSVGALADGFPSDLVPVPDGSQVLVSTAEPRGDDLLEISLNLRSPLETTALLDAFRGPLVAAGFTETPEASDDAALAAQATFSRSDGTELLVLGILDRDGVRTLTLGGTVRAAS